MRYRIHFAICVSLCASTSCSREEPQAPGYSPNAPGKDEWTAGHALPLLRADLVMPRKDADSFVVDALGCKFPKDRKQPKPPSGTPFQSDEQAVAAARAWITEHFGDLPDGVALSPTSILHSSSGRSAPAFEWDFGHTISFSAFYRGIQTSNSSILYITGRTEISGTIDLRRYTPLESRLPVVSPEAAKAAWRTRMAESDNSGAVLEQFEAKARPRLRFVSSPQPNRGADSSYDILAPAWVLDDEELLMVDGHSGKPWFND